MVKFANAIAILVIIYYERLLLVSYYGLLIFV